eukprot:6205989-Pleurochrysis_carterae.AAC.1
MARPHAASASTPLSDEWYTCERGEVLAGGSGGVRRRLGEEAAECCDSEGDTQSNCSLRGREREGEKKRGTGMRASACRRGPKDKCSNIEEDQDRRHGIARKGQLKAKDCFQTALLHMFCKDDRAMSRFSKQRARLCGAHGQSSKGCTANAVSAPQVARIPCMHKAMHSACVKRQSLPRTVRSC